MCAETESPAVLSAQVGDIGDRGRDFADYIVTVDRPLRRQPVTTTDYLRPQQVAEMLGWTEKTLRTYRNRGGSPPFVKVRNRVLYPADDLARWIADEAKKAENKKARQ